MWQAVGTSFRAVARTSETFATKEGRWDEGHILPGEGVRFIRGSTELHWTSWCLADREKARYYISERDQLRNVAVMTCPHAAPPLLLQGGGGSVNLTIELLSLDISLPPPCAPGGVRTDCGSWSARIRRKQQLPLAEGWCWRKCQRRSTHRVPCVLGAPRPCRQEVVNQCSTEGEEMEAGCVQGLHKVQHGGRSAGVGRVG